MSPGAHTRRVRKGVSLNNGVRRLAKLGKQEKGIGLRPEKRENSETLRGTAFSHTRAL